MWVNYYCIVVLFGIVNSISFNLINTQETLIVEVQSGKIRGRLLRNDNGKVYYGFQQIPYAGPPTGKNRFKPPEDPEKWRGILDATANTRICIQNIPNFLSFSIILDIWPTISEDCLHLNVFTPKKPGSNIDALLPVMIWIHGGSFQSDDSKTYGSSYFMDYGIVVVTINYRLGPFGFLSTEDDVIPGNIGLKDQHKAIQWVANNIRQFGGDPGKVVIAGESAGAASVGYHLVSHKNRGLFRGAILQSGSSLAAHEYQPSAKQYAFQLGRALNGGVDLENSAELLRLLQDASTLDIVKASSKVNNTMRNTATSLVTSVWVPTIEKNSDQAFISVPMHEAFITGQFNRVPTLLGFNSEEALTFIFDVRKAIRKAKQADQNIESIVDTKLHVKKDIRNSIGKQLRSIYTNLTFSKDISSFVKFLSDNSYIRPLLRQAECSSKYSPVYAYQFSRKKSLSIADLINIRGLEHGVGHAEELIFLWDLPLISAFGQFTESFQITKNRLLKIWTNFVKYLHPTPEKDTLLENLEWPQFTTEFMTYVDINITLKVQENPRHYREISSILNKYIEPPLNVY